MLEVITGLWFYVPIGLANSTAPVISKLPGLRKLTLPLDFGKSWRGTRIFGKNKTFRGLIGGMIMATIIVAIQRWLYINSDFIRSITTINYEHVNPFILGPLCGAGALLGDAVESFFKRRVGIEPGGSWVPFDQIDYLIGAILLTSLYIQLPLVSYLSFFIVGALLVPVTNYIGYLIGFKDVPW